ncbi:MAG: hypothetical protein R3Y56_05220 [Akkermansia sp.]
MNALIKTALTTCFILPLMAEDETFSLFYSDEAQRPFLEKSLAQLPQHDWKWYKLEENPITPTDIKAVTLARIFNIQVSPSLLIIGADGRYQKLRGDLITPTGLKVALKRLPEGQKADPRTVILAKLAEERALSSSPDVSAATIEQSVATCYQALKEDSLSDEDRQRIGLRLLYPLLMRQYSRTYKRHRAHTPETEAKLLEAVKAVETARDINPTSALGREAFTQRDELRKARIKARAYE